MSRHRASEWGVEDVTDEAHRWAYQRAARRAVEVGLMAARVGLESVTACRWWRTADGTVSSDDGRRLPVLDRVRRAA